MIRDALSRVYTHDPHMHMSLCSTGGLLDKLALYLWPRAIVGVPYDSAVDALQRLSRRYSFVRAMLRYYAMLCCYAIPCSVAAR